MRDLERQVWGAMSLSARPTRWIANIIGAPIPVAAHALRSLERQGLVQRFRARVRLSDGYATFWTVALP